MNSRATRKFWAHYQRLPANIRKIAIKQYRLWLRDPNYPSLKFKRVSSYWSARVTDDYRVLGIMEADTVIWFWIGTHSEYERLLR